MRAKTVIRGAHWFITAGLLLVVVSFIWLNHTQDHRESDVLQNSHRINDQLWMYTTRNDNGGATVPTIYRYYLADQLHGTDDQKIMELKQLIPFMEGYGSISSVTQENHNMLKVAYSGKVLSLDNTASYTVSGTPVTIKLSYQIN